MSSLSPETQSLAKGDLATLVWEPGVPVEFVPSSSITKPPPLSAPQGPRYGLLGRPELMLGVWVMGVMHVDGGRQTATPPQLQALFLIWALPEPPFSLSARSGLRVPTA